VVACAEDEDDEDCGAVVVWRPEPVSVLVLDAGEVDVAVEAVLARAAVVWWPGIVAAATAAKTTAAPRAVPAAPTVSPRSLRSALSRALGVGCVMHPRLCPAPWPSLGAACELAESGYVSSASAART
jgi:hypothetical protein